MRYWAGENGRRYAMDDPEFALQNRRAFLSKLGKTLAVGLGFGLMANATASGTSNNCETQCFPIGDCSGCTSPDKYFHCHTVCGDDYNFCFSNRTCTTFCLAGC
jgi:hypothetical protein